MWLTYLGYNYNSLVQKTLVSSCSLEALVDNSVFLMSENNQLLLSKYTLFQIMGSRGVREVDEQVKEEWV